MSDIVARTAVWKGLNRMPYIEDGEMRSMKNLSSDAYPFLTTRKGREEYKMNVYVPGVPGDGYLEDVEALPEEMSEDDIEKYDGQIVKLTKDPDADPYEACAFYWYDSENEKWVKGINNENFIGIADKVPSHYKTSQFSGEKIPYGDKKYREEYEGDIIKYMGESTKKFVYGTTYEYKLQVEAYWERVYYATSIPSGEIIAVDQEDEIPEASEEYASNRTAVRVKTEVPRWYYICCLKGYGYWEKVNPVYTCAVKIPETPEANQMVRYTPSYSGSSNLKKMYYTCDVEYDGSEYVYFYTAKEECYDDFEKVDTLPEAKKDNCGKTYYCGTTSGFYICNYDGEGKYSWKPTEQPMVKKVKTLDEFLRDQKNTEINEIHEIGQLNGELAVLFENSEGEEKLCFCQNLYDVKNFLNTPGRKLETVGNKLLAGESGSYLYYKKVSDNDEASTAEANSTESTDVKRILEHYKATDQFAETIKMGFIPYGWDKGVGSSIVREGDTYTIKIYDNPNSKVLKELYDKLEEKAAFKVETGKYTAYLELTRCNYTKEKSLGGYKNGDEWVHDSASLLEIVGKGTSDFPRNYYYNALTCKGNFITINIISTDPQFFDVVAWKKRLWGYEDNYIQGTVQDIFAGEGGKIDWITGNNTYTEAISQPLWQGGNITGLAALREALIVFKEDNLTVFTGNYPAIMQGSTISCRGLPPENRESVAVANESVYYLSEDGVYRFSGGIPQCISENIKIKGTDAVGASDGRKYWLSLKEEDGNYALYVYDIRLGTWYKEDSVAAVSFVMIGSKMYMATRKQIFCLDAPQEELEWEAELWFDEETYKLKKYKEFHVRGNLGECEVYLKADDGEWQAYAFTENKLSIKAEPFMCHELGLKLKGKGICEIKSLDRTYEVVE